MTVALLEIGFADAVCVADESDVVDDMQVAVLLFMLYIYIRQAF